MQRILIETGHPGQVHQFRYAAQLLQQKGHRVLFATKRKDLCVHLLDAYHLPYVIVGTSGKKMVSKILRLFQTYLRFFIILMKFRPTLVFSRFTPECCHLTWLLRIPHVGFTDSEHIRLMDAVTVPFTPIKFTAHSYWKHLGKNHFRYNGNIELFYLHPHHFTPDPSINQFMGIEPGEPYAILRFISWNAYHDLGQSGLSLPDKREIIDILQKKMRVFISSEDDLPEEFRMFRISFPPERMHDALAFAKIYIGEGATMASEAAILGVPSIYINSLTAGSIEDAADAGLLYSFRNRDGLISKLKELLNDTVINEKHQLMRDRYLADKCDITGFVVWFAENYPDSFHILKKNPSFALTGQTPVI
jgi:uncharacterized protein